MSIFRNRFAVILSGVKQPPGFIYDYHRMPPVEVDNGSILSESSYWDGSNAQAIDRVSLTDDSGTYNWHPTKSYLWLGQPWLQAGIGDNNDMLFSGLVNVSGEWYPKIFNGTFYDKNNELFLYSDNAVELIVSGSSAKVFDLPSKPQDFTPIFVGSFYVDSWSRAYLFNNYNYKTVFTASGTNTPFPIISGSNPSIYNIDYSLISWSNVDTTNNEFVVDRANNKLLINKNIVGSIFVNTLGRRQNKEIEFQLPLVPVEELTTTVTAQIFEYYVEMSGNTGEVKIHGGIDPIYQDPLNFLCDVNYVRSSGYASVNVSASGFVSGNSATAFSGWYSSGLCLVDLGDSRVYVFEYASRTDSTLSGLSSYLPSQFGIPNNSLLRQAYDTPELSGSTIIPNISIADGLYSFYYVKGELPYSLDKNRGILTIPALSGAARVYITTSYTPGLFVTYEPSGSSNVLTYSGLDLNPLLRGNNHGILSASLHTLVPEKITISTDQSIDTNNKLSIYAGSDYLTINIAALDRDNIPVANVPVKLTFDRQFSVGYVDGVEPSVSTTLKTTNALGEARFVYTPPDKIQGLGYFVNKTNVINGSGLTLPEPVIMSELASGSAWNTLLFGIWDNDGYLDFTETSGLYTYEADGRFELVTAVSGAAYGTTIWKPVTPSAALDQNGNILPISATSSGVYTLVYPSGAIPTDTNIQAYFISAEKEIRIGAVTSNGYAVAPTFGIKVKIPRFMTGEFYWGQIDDPTTSSFDSISYLTINPFTSLDLTASRANYRSLGNVFKIISTISSKLRNKFYVSLDVDSLRATPTGQQELRKAFGLRNRFILEV